MLEATLVQLVFQSFAMVVTSALIPGLRVTGVVGPIGMVLGISALNMHYWDENLFFALPTGFDLQVFTLLLANGAIFFVLVKILPGIEIDGLMPALAGPVVFTACASLIHHYEIDANWRIILHHIEQFMIGLKSTLGQGASSVAN